MQLLPGARRKMWRSVLLLCLLACASSSFKLCAARGMHSSSSASQAAFPGASAGAAAAAATPKSGGSSITVNPTSAAINITAKHNGSSTAGASGPVMPMPAVMPFVRKPGAPAE